MELLGLLQARREWTGAELRDRLEVSDRTLRRDIDDLRDLGYGIEATRGRHGGYRLGPGASVPPLTLAAPEAVAIAVGLRAVGAGAVGGLEEASASALAKLERSLGAATRREISDVSLAMLSLDDAGTGIAVETIRASARAIREARRLRLTYVRQDGQTSERVVEPHRAVHGPRAWYLVAWDTSRAAWRTLRMDRISRAEVLGESFAPRRIPDELVREYTTHSITTAPYPVHAQVLVQAPAEDVRSVFGPTIAQVTDNGDGTSMLTAGGNDPREFVLYLALSGFRFRTGGNEELRSAARSMIATLKDALDTGETARTGEALP